MNELFHQEGGKVIMTLNRNWQWISAKGGDEMVSAARVEEKNNQLRYQICIWVMVYHCGSHIFACLHCLRGVGGRPEGTFLVRLESLESHHSDSAPSRINEASIIPSSRRKIPPGIPCLKSQRRAHPLPGWAPRNYLWLQQEYLNTEAGDCSLCGFLPIMGLGGF